jgi:dihydrofolate reductase
MHPKPIHCIVAVAPDSAIGASGKLAWHIPEDTRQFMAQTEGGVMIERPLCYAELGQALPHRGTVVVSRDPAKSFPGATRAASLAEAIKVAQAMPWPGPIWITGGERVYAEGLPLCSRLYITRVGLSIEGDRFFTRDWEARFPRILSQRQSHQGEVSLSFEVRAPLAS